MSDEDRGHGHDDRDRGRWGESATAAERAAHGRRETERERVCAEPFDHPYPEHWAGGQGRRHMSGAQAVADAPPGVLGGYRTPGGGRPGATGATHPPTAEPRDTTSRTGSAEPGGDDEGPVNRSGR
ncbi:hypothetical protein GCM10010260_27160 [Streptomyces filipinensis]|uniref:Uncharacterized protein n=1 Tax=Streptomyces filipinensis TaxID=66887 RepID=A0A918I9Q8_9ACTN|nr:hypothetical protein [Streptomyces filipinensis]GGU91371.1 hypothetical protein GCM10010260_27160 [Streptomyces filipinensis]